MSVDYCTLCCQECGPLSAVWQWQMPWSIKFDRILPSYFNRGTNTYKTAKPKSDHKPTTDLTKYLPQYLVDEDISSHHSLCMHGEQMPVPYGCTYLLLWGCRFMGCPYFWLHLLLIWQVLQDFVNDRIVVCIPFQYIAAFIISSRRVCPGCCR